MEKLVRIVVVFAILLMATMASAKDFSAWVLGDNESMTARLGYNVSTNTGVGLESCWLKYNEVPQVWAGYGLYKFPDVVQIPNPIALDWLPKTLSGTAYVGAHAGFNLDTQGAFSGLLAGIIVEKVIVFEWQYIKADYELAPVDNENKFIIGIVFRF